MTSNDMPECVCPLIDVSTWGGKPEFLLGDPRGTGCPIHETQAMRDEIKAAEDRARYGERADPTPLAFLSDLPQATFTVSGTFDAMPASFWPTTPNPVQVTYQTPANRWHAWLWRLSTIRAFRWIKPRMTTHKFTGTVEPWPDFDGLTIHAQPEEDAP